MIKYLMLMPLLISCSSTEPTNPTPFETTDKKVIVTGCEQLRKENKEADC